MTTHPAQPLHHALPEERAADGWWLPGPDGFAACALSASSRTVAEARRFTRSTLASWRMCDTVTEDTALVVSELVSNALRYGSRGSVRRTACPERADGLAARVCPAWLALTRQGRRVLCAVSDGGSAAPRMTTADPLAESGRGLQIVDLLSDAWGWTPPDRTGKTVWATLSRRG